MKIFTWIAFDKNGFTLGLRCLVDNAIWLPGIIDKISGDPQRLKINYFPKITWHLYSFKHKQSNFNKSVELFQWMALDYNGLCFPFFFLKLQHSSMVFLITHSNGPKYQMSR